MYQHMDSIVFSCQMLERWSKDSNFHWNFRGKQIISFLKCFTKSQINIFGIKQKDMRISFILWVLCWANWASRAISIHWRTATNSSHLHKLQIPVYQTSTPYVLWSKKTILCTGQEKEEHQVNSLSTCAAWERTKYKKNLKKKCLRTCPTLPKGIPHKKHLQTLPSKSLLFL